MWQVEMINLGLFARNTERYGRHGRIVWEHRKTRKVLISGGRGGGRRGFGWRRTGSRAVAGRGGVGRGQYRQRPRQVHAAVGDDMGGGRCEPFF